MNNLFSDTKEAFSLKSNFELNRAFFLFKIIGNTTFVKLSTVLTNFALKFHLPVTPIIKATVFDHFCGGVNEEDCVPVINKMFNKNVHSVLDFSTEGFDSEKEFDDCLRKKISIIEFAKNKKEIPFAVFKPTCLGSTDLFKKVSKLPIDTLKMHHLQIVKNSVMAIQHKRNPENFNLFSYLPSSLCPK